jgi:hypothetical protein
MKLCKEKAEKRKRLLEKLTEDGEVSDSYSYELQSSKILESKDEIENFLQEELLIKLEDEIRSIPEEEKDYVLNRLVNFIKANYRFPNSEEISEIEKEAEKERISKLPPETSNVAVKKELTQKNIVDEILEIAEEIFKRRSIIDPKSIVEHVDEYDDALELIGNDFDLIIKFDTYFGLDNSRAYSCSVKLPYGKEVWMYLGNIYTRISIAYLGDEKCNLPIEQLLSIHKFMMEKANEDGLECMSELDL